MRLLRKCSNSLFDPLACLRRDPDFAAFVLATKGGGPKRLLRNEYEKRYGGFPYREHYFNYRYYRKANNLPKRSSRKQLYQHWMMHGRSGGLPYAPGKSTLLKIVLKTKNEGWLLESWITHHAKIVGFENLVIVDHGSTDSDVLRIYKKYRKKILILPLPEEVFCDRIHNLRRFRYFYNFLREQCRFFTILDTDEFLVHNNNGTLTTNNVIPEVQKQQNKQVIGTTWVYNVPYTGTKQRPTNITDFSLDTTLLHQNIVKGKSIVRNDYASEICGHNAQAPNCHVVPSLLLLHLKFRNPHERIRSKITYCISKGLLPKEASEAELMAIIKAIPPEERHYGLKEIYTYLTNKETYGETLPKTNPEDVLHTDILRSQTTQTTQKDPRLASLSADIRSAFTKALPYFEQPGATIEQ